MKPNETMSPEQRTRISTALKGRTHSPASIARMRASAHKRYANKTLRKRIGDGVRASTEARHMLLGKPVPKRRTRADAFDPNTMPVRLEDGSVCQYIDTETGKTVDSLGREIKE